MSTTSERAGQRRQDMASVRNRAQRLLLAMLLALGLTGLAACGFGAQTLRPYTQAEGVNFDVGDPSDLTSVVHVRNLLLISKTPGEAVVSGAVSTNGRDQLTGLTGTPIKADGTDGAPFSATLTNTVSIANGTQVLLTDTPITVRSPDIQAGLTANVTVTFSNVGEYTAAVTIVDGNQPEYASITPAPAATSSV